MKYCPYCGADLIDGAASFCAECGKTLPSGTEEFPKASEPRPEKKARSPQSGTKNDTRRKKKKKKKAQSVEGTAPQKRQGDDDYDGYYDDVLPSDLGKLKEGIDKELVKKIAAITGVMLLIVGLCVLAMYLL